MSSTNRGYDRHATDYYITPPSCIKEFLGSWLADLHRENPDNLVSSRPERAVWLDPCAGGDTKHGMSYPDVLDTLFGTSADTMDVRDDSLAQRKENYLLAEVDPNFYDVIITNPPFYLAQEIIIKALQDVKDGGYVVMLLRLNFFGSKGRYPFFEKQLPKWCYVHHRRMSFTDDGKTDSIEYMHAVWQKGTKPEYTMLKII